MFTKGMTPIRVFYTLVRYGEDGAKDYIDAYQNRNTGFQTFQRIMSPFKNRTRADIKGLLRRDYSEEIESDPMFQSLDKTTPTIIRELSVLLAFVAQGIDKPIDDMNISELISAFVEEGDSTKKERMAGLAYESEGSVARKIAFFPIDELDVGGQYRKLGIATPTDRKFVSVIYPDLWEHLRLPKPRKSESFKDTVSAEGATSRMDYEVIQDSETSIKYIQFLANEKSQKRRGAMSNQMVKMLVPKIAGRDMTKKNTIVFKKGKKGYTMNSYIRQLFESGVDYVKRILRGVIPLSDEEVREYFVGELGSGLYERLFEFPNLEEYNKAIAAAKQPVERDSEEEIQIVENEDAKMILVKDKNEVSDFMEELDEDVEFTQAEIEKNYRKLL